MTDLPATLYTGEKWDDNVFVLIPQDIRYLPQLWAFCSSPEFARQVRQINQKLNIKNAILLSVPFDLERWKKVAEESGPLPIPYSDDPTQWLFKGAPADSIEPLHVAVARLLGYRWPDQPADLLDELIDEDGIVCTPGVSGEQPAAERLRGLLAAAHVKLSSGRALRGAGPWPQLPGDARAWIDQLLADAGSPGKTLEQWLRDDFFTQHCSLFSSPQARPFIWQVWDGERDGFSVLVNYHKLDRKNLERLVYHYLNAWIDTQQKLNDAGEAGAERKLIAAQELKRKLELILAGEPPYDIYVRWKSEAQQPMGWEPDLDDGVRLNIRPFMTADVLRRRPNIKWGVDRGKNPDGSVRDNDKHLTLAEKREAGARAGA